VSRRPEPGEQGTPRELERAPGERYLAAADVPVHGRTGPAVGHAAAFGVGASAVAAALWWLTGGLFGLEGGLVVVGAAMGWLIGTGVAWGAWGERIHRPETRLRLLAVGLAVATWIVGSFLVYVFVLAVALPASTHGAIESASLSLAERMALLPFAEFVGQQFLPFGPLELLVLAVFAWRAAR
jgi:hypothetical protein